MDWVLQAILVGLTGFYVWYTSRLVRLQGDPCVIVYTAGDKSRPQIIQIVVRNAGASLARDVEFSLSQSIPSRAFGFDAAKPGEVEFMSSGPLFDGIPALAPGEERRIDWGMYPKLSSALGTEKVYVKTTYVRGTKRLPPTHSVLEVESWKGTVASRSDLTRLADSFEKVERALTSAFRSRRLHVATATEDEINKAMHEAIQAHKAELEAHAAQQGVEPDVE